LVKHLDYLSHAFTVADPSSHFYKIHEITFFSENKLCLGLGWTRKKERWSLSLSLLSSYMLPTLSTRSRHHSVTFWSYDNSTSFSLSFSHALTNDLTLGGEGAEKKHLFFFGVETKSFLCVEVDLVMAIYLAVLEASRAARKRGTPHRTTQRVGLASWFYHFTV